MRNSPAMCYLSFRYTHNNFLKNEIITDMSTQGSKILKKRTITTAITINPETLLIKVPDNSHCHTAKENTCIFFFHFHKVHLAWVD